MLLLPLFFAILLIWYLVRIYKWKKNVYDHLVKLPGIPWYPILGSTYPFIKVPRSELFDKLAEVATTWKLFYTWNGNVPEVNIMKPEHLQIVLRSSTHVRKARFYDYLFDWLGEGLLISEGPKWFLQRKLMTPSFHFKTLEKFVDVFADNSNNLLKFLETKTDGKYFDALPVVASCALDIFCETAIGLPASVIADRKEKYIESLYGMTEMAMWRQFRPHYRWGPLFHALPQGRMFRYFLKTLHDVSDYVIAEKKKVLKNSDNNEIDLGTKKRLSFLDIALNATDNQTMLTDQDLRGLVDTFLFAGFDTTSTSTSWSIFLLGSHPEIQERVFEEVRGVLKDKPTPTTIEELNKLKYLECVAKESLRLFPVLAFISRILSEDIELDGYKIPAGVQAIIHIAAAHRDPEHFPEPNKFIPDRFLPENSKTRHPFAFIPFSAGPRNCIGQKFAMLEEKTILASIVNNYKIISLESLEEKKAFPHTLVRPQTGIKIKLEKRERD